jgi:hypothetical protein
MEKEPSNENHAKNHENMREGRELRGGEIQVRSASCIAIGEMDAPVKQLATKYPSDCGG